MQYAAFLFLLLFLSPPSLSLAQLTPSFYSGSCPNAVSTVTNTIVSRAKQDNVVAPSMLRLILHDCFVEGCDGSILISSTSGNKAERDADVNSNLPQNAFDAIIAAKKAVEQICPGVVSCADILSLASRDVVVFLGGPTWDVPLGRFDGRVSTASSVAGRLPLANMDVTQLTDNFAAVGLSLQDMVILSGAHTVGFTHCDQFENRLYNFNSAEKLDPSLNPGFAQQLQKQCPANGPDNLQQLDAVSPFTFDNSYYNDLQQGKGVLFSDQVLFEDPTTKTTVSSMAASQDAFFKSFVDSMIKMTSIGVKGVAQGEVRKDCTIINPGGPNIPSPSPPPANLQPSASPPPHSGQQPSSSPPSSQQPSLSPPLQPPVTPSRPIQQAPRVSPPPPSPQPSPPIQKAPLVSPSPPSPLPSRPIQQAPLVSPPPPSPIPTPVRLPPPVQASSPPPPATPIQVPSPPVSPNPPPRGGITIPGIPGFTPPIHIPFPGFGVGPPPSSSSRSRKSGTKEN